MPNNCSKPLLPCSLKSIKERITVEKISSISLRAWTGPWRYGVIISTVIRSLGELRCRTWDCCLALLYIFISKIGLFCLTHCIYVWCGMIFASLYFSISGAERLFGIIVFTSDVDCLVSLYTFISDVGWLLCITVFLYFTVYWLTNNTSCFAQAFL